MNRTDLLKRIGKNKSLYVFMLPAFLTILVFSYVPMVGVLMAFQDYNPAKGFFHSPFVGWNYFSEFLGDHDFYNALKNTLAINFLMLVIGFPLPIIFSLLLNEVRAGVFKRVVQSISYLPHFISWVVISGIVYRLLEQDYGIVNLIIEWFGGEKIAFFREAKYFWGILVSVSLLKELGWTAIIYLAALAGIDPHLYEAASLDGAGRWKKMIHITLPGISTTIILMFIFTIGNLITSVGGAGFDAVFNLQNAMVGEKSTTLDYYIYYQGLKMNRMSFAAAIGLAQSVIALALVIATNAISRKARGYGAF